MKVLVYFSIFVLTSTSEVSASLKCSGCTEPELKVKEILDLLELSKPIFADIKALSEKRIDEVERPFGYLSLSLDEKKNLMAEDIESFRNIFESNEHVPFPVENYTVAGLEHINSNSGNSVAIIDYFVTRGQALYKEVSNIRRKIMSQLAGVTYEEWSSYLDDESKPIPFPLSCTLPHVRESKAFRTQAAADLTAYGENKKSTLPSDCSEPELHQNEILDLLEKSTAIFDSIKQVSELRIDDVDNFITLPLQAQRIALEAELNDISNVYADHGHTPFPINRYINNLKTFLEGSVTKNTAINYFVTRGQNLYNAVANIRRPIMADLAGVTLEEWSSYLDDESLAIPFPLSCTLPNVRLNREFRTKAAADLKAYGEAKKV